MRQARFRKGKSSDAAPVPVAMATGRAGNDLGPQYSKGQSKGNAKWRQFRGPLLFTWSAASQLRVTHPQVQLPVGRSKWPQVVIRDA